MNSLSLFTFHFHALEKEMATHSSILAWRIPGMGAPGGLPAVYGIAQSWTRLKRLRSSSSNDVNMLPESAVKHPFSISGISFDLKSELN